MDAHELEGVWAKVLRAVRDEKQFALFGLLSTLNDIEFADGKIFLRAHNDAEKNMLKQHLDTLQNLTDGAVELVLTDNTVTVADDQRETIARLKELFGDKVEIV